MAVLTARSQSRRKILGIACSAISIVSMALMVILFDPSRDPSRVYYGTDTRIFSLMAGALIAIYEDQIRKLFAQPLPAEGAGWLSLSALLKVIGKELTRLQQLTATILLCRVVS
jgi:peptidoglycan/LPS O-acetylase OafA/YrhL